MTPVERTPEVDAAMVEMAVKAARGVDRLCCRGRPGQFLGDMVAAGVIAQLEALDRHDPAKGPIKGYFYRCAWYGALRWFNDRVYRHEKRELIFLDDMDGKIPATDHDWPELDSPAESAATAVRAAIAALPLNQRHAVRRRFFDGATLDEIGAELGKNRDAARNAVKKGLMTLRRTLPREAVY